MKYGELVKLLKKSGCNLVKQESRHEKWQSKDGISFRVPRHKQEIPTGTLNSIKKDAGVK